MEYVLQKDHKNVDLMINKFNKDSFSLVNQLMVFHNYMIHLNIDSKKKSEILVLFKAKKTKSVFNILLIAKKAFK